MPVILDQPQITVIRPQGSITALNAMEFKGQLTTAVAQEGHNGVLVDLGQVDTLDSAGLMALVSALKLAQDLDRRFSLCSVAPSIRIIFELTQLDRVFEMFENVAAFEAAIA